MPAKARSVRRPKKRSFQQEAVTLENLAGMKKLKRDPPPRKSKPRTTSKKEVEKALQTTQHLLEATRTELHDSEEYIASLEQGLITAEEALTRTRTSLLDATNQNVSLYRLLRVERRKNQRNTASKAALSLKLKEQSAALTSSQNSLKFAVTARNTALEAEAHAQASLRRVTSHSESEIARYKNILTKSRSKVRGLQTQNLRTERSRNKAVEKALKSAKKKENRWRLVKNGMYTGDARAMARFLHRAGCTQGKVGAVIKYVAEKSGLVVKETMSRCSVQRAIMEGGVAARIQLAHEMAQADGLTASGDATSLRAENYESSHVMINKNGTHKNRVLGITSTVDHTSEGQVENWKSHLAKISDIFKRSPLGRRSRFSFEISDFLRLLRGMFGDHASDQKKTVRLMLAWKEEVARILLGWDEISASEASEILEIMAMIREQNIAEVGGEAEWNKLSDEDRDVLCKSSMDALALGLGSAAYDRLSPEEKREMSLFFWAGCSMHKELNSCKAFADGMSAYWVVNELEPPVLLANKDNDATIELSRDTGTSTAAVQRALKVSERGAVKLIGLFGAYVNHKDAKKGCHDTYENHFRPLIGPGVRFPGVSNVRYQAYGLGAARIISYLEEHRDFMLFMKDRKEKRTFNHMEENILKGLNCNKTIAEMVAFSLYCMSTCHPYAAHARGLGTENLNLLSLGPYHEDLKRHIQKLVDNPELLLSDAPDAYVNATLDGRSWSDPIAHAACLKLARTLPDVKPLFVHAAKHTLPCWDRFTAEFKEGGAIDLSSEAEKDEAFMESTNDKNESLLGSWRKFSHYSPSSTIGHFEDQALFNRNDTQAFMDQHLTTDEDQRFLMQEVRTADASGVERRRREELDAHHQEVVDAKRAKDAVRAAKLDLEVIDEMTNAALKDQLELYRERGDKDVPMKSKLPRKADLLAAVRAALGRYEASITSTVS
ncbi:hypothetical protein C8R43DRAFT_1126450 [Mycena crocata]|nr:hypothetical protein C8R43DRAFT_1126450 [Mycena crocata]